MGTSKKKPKEIEYPECDGRPMADNTLHYDWITKIQLGLDLSFVDRADVFVAADLLWYPVEGRPDIYTAPDGLVAMGRPKGDRGAYLQWKEGGLAPQVVFEVLSPGNRAGRIVRKYQFYERYGVSEFYMYDPHKNEVTGWVRKGAGLAEVMIMNGWTSPLLGIRFQTTPQKLVIIGTDGRPFQTYREFFRECAETRRQAEEWRRRRAEGE
jgi:Uma2 family endonuclease